MKFFCEVVVKDILPMVRAEISRELILKYGLTQTEVSQKLGITQAAISQYISRSRSKKIIDQETSKYITEACNKIVREDLNEYKIMELIWNICLDLVKKDKNVFIPKEI